MITMRDTAYVSVFMDNDLTHITEDHFQIKLIARLLDQMYVIQPPMLEIGRMQPSCCTIIFVIYGVKYIIQMSYKSQNSRYAFY